MFWEFTIKVLVSQLILLFLYVLILRAISIRDFICKYWNISRLIIWGITFTLMLAMGGLIFGLILSFTTVGLLGLWVKFRKHFSYMK